MIIFFRKLDSIGLMNYDIDEVSKISLPSGGMENGQNHRN
jgi:hypothetical protein